MKKYIIKFTVALMCLCMIMSFVACGKENKKGENAQVDFGYADMEFKYSLDCSQWYEVKQGNEMFDPNATYFADGVEVVYLHVKNHSNVAANYKVAFSGSATENIEFGYVENIRAAFSTKDNAKTAVGENFKSLSSGYVYTRVIEAESTTTFALVISSKTVTSGKDLGLNIVFKGALGGDTKKENSAKVEDGKFLTNAHTYAIIEDSSVDTVAFNDDNSLQVTIPKNTIKQGEFMSIAVESTYTAENQLNYTAVFGPDRKFDQPVKISLLVGYGLKDVVVTWGSEKIESTYDMYSGCVKFTAVPQSAVFRVDYSGVVDIEGVIVQGYDEKFNTFHDAVEFASNNSSETMSLVVFGRANYTVQTGERFYFARENSIVKTINVIGGNASAEIFITQNSGSVPSLPYAIRGMKINYLNLSFQSENELQEGGEYSRHFDYRGDADISFENCTFYKALATRGPSSNVVVKNCDFKCPTYEDTFKGYCYYSVQKIGGGDITVDFIDNDCTGNWGGVNLDWAEADFTVTGNKFGGYNCSKPAIQLSHAKTMFIENNSFTNITDENAFRIYGAYNASSTRIVGNTIESDYIIQSDKPGAINSLNDFVFEYNIISKNTNLTLGHEANAPADQVSPHGYVIDTTLNTIK